MAGQGSSALCSAQAGAVAQDCGLHCKWNSHHTHAQMCTS